MTEKRADLGAGQPVHPSDFDQRFRKRARLLLSFSLLLLLAHAFIPFQEFVHRGDDAFYYFKIAVNYPSHGFWTFDGLHPSNGVQPLWGFVLTATAQVLAWVGVTDADLLARIFVAETALIHFAACMLLFHLLSRYVSLGAGVAAAGAFLFPMGIVWTRVWGMENSLYALVLLTTVLFYQQVFRERGTVRNAALLGILLGTTTLARLNAGFLIPVLLCFYLFGRRHGSFRRRFQLAFVIGAVASALIVPYLAWNLVHTGHVLPVGAGAKAVRAEHFLQSNGVESVLSGHFLSVIYDWAGDAMRWFLTSRALDGTWLAGGRIPFGGEVPYLTLGWVLAFFLLAPFLADRPWDWLRTLRDQCRRLAPFTYVLVFALVNAAVSIVSYPYEATYALKRWWLLESEIVITTLVATLVAASIGFLGSHWVPKRARLGLATGWLAFLVVFHAQRTIRFYWDGEEQFPDWNISTNDQRYRAAMWIRDNLPDDAIIGSWNAGVIGYYTDCHVVNLDGLINSWDFLPYLARKALAEYIKKEGIQYLADTNYELAHRAGAKLDLTLNLTLVYERYMDPNDTGFGYRQQTFRIYRVED